ncbi:MAG TPA: DUF2480 family protein [Chryseolinea sp.]|nr:DUF2480 family protein [Chryseolinea sp.]
MEQSSSPGSVERPRAEAGIQAGDGIINRVASSALVTFDLEEYYEPGDRVVLDIADQLYEGLILREKDFRDFIKNHDWRQYEGKFVAITCSADAIVPTWAFMLVMIALEPYAKQAIFGSVAALDEQIFRKRLAAVDWRAYEGAKVVIKGCSKVAVPVAVYVEATAQIRRYATSIMYGEPCSTVPLFKKSLK